MYVSISQFHAKFSVRWIRRQVEYNTRWAQTFGLKPGKRWTDEHAEIVCTNVTDETGMPIIVTILAMGITGTIRGFNPDDYRPDLIIMDDVLDEENTATEEQRKKIDALLFGALLNSLAPNSEAPLAKACFAQTPLHKEDAINKCMKDPQWNPLKFSIFLPNGESAWPERYPTDVLVKDKEAHIRRGQYRLWMREKEVTIVAGEDKAIDTSKWKTYDVLPERFDAIISLDPASSEAKTADEFAIVALGFQGRDVYVLDYACERAMMPDAACNHCFNLMLLYSPRKGVVESNGFQRTMKWIFEQEMQKRRMYLAMDLLEVRTKNADRIMQTIPGLSAYGHFHIRPSHTKLIQQADDYDPSVKDIKDDLLTAIANGILASNPAMRARLKPEDSGEAIPLDESEYEDLTVGGAP